MHNVRLKRNQIFDLNGVLSGIDFGKKLPSRFRFMLHSNVELTKGEVEATNQTFADSDEIVSLREARIKIMESYGIKDESEASGMDRSELDKMNAEIKVLMDANQDVIEETEEMYRERDAFMIEDVDIALKQVDIDHVPEIPIIDGVNHWSIWNAIKPVITSGYKKIDVTTTRRELIDLHSVLVNTNFDLPISNKFRFVATSNVDLIADEMNDIDEKFVIPEEYFSVQEGRGKKLAELNADTEKKFNALSDVEREDVQKQIDQYNEDHKEVTELATKVNAERNEYLDVEIDFPLYLIDNVDEIPVLSDDNNINEWLIFKFLTLMVKEK